MGKNIKLIIGSTRQGRNGKPIADWLVKEAKTNGIDLGVLDLKEIDLPFFEGMSPAMVPTQVPEGKKWASMVGETDGFVFLTPEYNGSVNAPLKNAIDFLYVEWNDKPAAIVSYGFTNGGLDSTNHLNDIIQHVKMNNVGQKIAGKLSRDDFDEKFQFKDLDGLLQPIKDSFIESLRSIEK